MGTGGQVKLLNKHYVLLTLVSLITSLGYSMIATLVSPYAVGLGANLTTAGTLSGIYSISALLIRPFGGYATDWFDKRSMCVFSTAVMCVAMLGYALAPGIGVMFAVRILHGAAFGVSGTANMALACEYVPKERLAEGLGYFGLGQVLSQVFGPGIGIAVRDRIGYRPLFILIAALTALAVLLLLFVRRGGAAAKKQRVKLSLQNLVAKECIVYALVGGVFSLCNGIVNSFLILLGEEREISGIALFFSANALVLFVMRLFIGKIADKKSLSVIVNISLATSAVSMAMTGNGKALWVMLAAAALKAVGQGGGQISLQSACIKKADALRVGIATSTFYIGADIGQGLGPIIGGKISSVFGYRAMFYCVAGVILLAMAVFNIYQRHSLKPAVEGAKTA